MRQLKDTEIAALKKNGCYSKDWSLVTVHEDFDPDTCFYSTFIGKCTIGDLSGYRDNELGIPLPNGIRHALIHECNIGNHVRIDHVHDCISRYDIGDNTTISNTCTLAMRGQSTFGNGTVVSVLDETGGIEVKICDLLTAHTAYLAAFMGHDKVLKKALCKLFSDYTETLRSDRGTVGENTSIKNAGTIINARIAPHTVIEGATLLRDCSLNSTPEQPVYIGQNVMAEHFIASSGARISGGSVIHYCFVGQSTKIDRLFSAEHSLFFANCQCENGESCAVFAGPYTVTMHKSSLLIAGHYSFLNAGSGSNQSNHLYKLGPMHFGVVERGSKTTSDSYVLWPSRIAPFSLIMGRHVHHVDTSDFPFSYVIENDNESYLVPGANLRSIGTIRDAKKWPQRDRRHPNDRMDCINFNLLSPFSIGKMERGYNRLKELRAFIGHHGKTYIYNNINIRSTSLEHGLRTYDLGIKKFIGNSVIQQMEGCELTTEESLRNCLKPANTESAGEWLDISGLIAPKTAIDKITDRIKSGELSDLYSINDAFHALHKSYYDLEWEWSYHLMCRWYGIQKHEDIDSALITRIVTEWMDAVVTIDKYLHTDAYKEHEIVGRISFANQRYADIDEKMEAIANNPIVLEVTQHIEKKRALGEQTLLRLSKIKG
ncbi:DUF4954 family protein [Porphyromonas sp.]|uniref:DUF4954 family protein n=1 Tax=Porphyromonas sp. TaxID=1924944 RepID=UPI0026DC3C89|nr:DUF4954 family protein [Porphyromonas sp.]MDO4771817.1 DUF4954 family protein [Porphyromonas sp.]